MANHGVDYYQIDDLLTNEERLIRDSVREWVNDKVLLIIEGCFRDAVFPNQLIPEMAELGLLGPTLPEEMRLPTATGLKSPLMCLSQARYGIAWGVMGAAEACYDSSINYCKTRVQWGKPIGAFQMVQNKLVIMLTELTKGQLLAFRLGRMKESGKATFRHISFAKRNNCEKALEIARIARDLHGANGIMDEYPIMRHMMNLESVYTYEGTHNMHTLIVGAEITGFEAFQG